MRITNKIVHNNSLYNINLNKTNEDTLNTMTSTGKKITRPSDDPVVAIRALRLRSNVSQLSQYYDKNSKDAESWLQVTEDALSTVSSVLTDSVKQAVKGSNKYLELDDLTTIVTQMDSLSDEYYSTGNVDYAGRYVFTGYRTDTSLTFDANTSKAYTGINDEFNASDVGTSSRVLGAYKISASTTGSPAESDITQTSIGRIRLSYSNLDTADVSLKYRTAMTVPATTTLATEDTKKAISLSYKNSAGTTVNVSLGTSRTAGKAGDTVTVGSVDYTATQNTDGTYTIAVGASGDTITLDSTGALKNASPTTLATDVSATISNAVPKIVSLNYKDASGAAVSVNVPTSGINGTTGEKVTLNGTAYTATQNTDGTYTIAFGAPSNTITLSSAGVATTLPATIESASATISTASMSTVSFSVNNSATPPVAVADTITVPVTGAVDQPYTMSVKSTNGTTYTATVNTDGTYTVSGASGVDDVANIVQLTANGSAHASYQEHTVSVSGVISSTTKEADIDSIYTNLAGETDKDKCYLNAETGELLLGTGLKGTLSALSDLTNAKTIDVVYNKNQWESGDIRPENLFHCTSGGITYNGGSSSHIMEYDVGYNQTVAVNTTADEVFTTGVKRDVDDLQNTLNQLKTLNTTLTTLKTNLSATTDTATQTKIQTQIDAAQKAYDYLREDMQTQFENKITSTQSALDQANVAVTENGTRSKRLDLIQSRLQSQTTTFKELQSDNEDADLAETATNLSTAELTYQAALMATGKIMQTSLMNYI